MSITTKKSRLVPGRTRLFALAAVAALLATPQTQAGPLAMPGDVALRHDIQRLADYGVIKGTVTLRWAAHLFKMPVAFYGQFIGEDEAAGFPSRYMGQMGIETTGLVGGRWSYRGFGEFAGTSCQFHLTSALAPLIRLSYGRMVVMALPYTVTMSLTGIAALWYLG
jgi:hypothetical protein